MKEKTVLEKLNNFVEEKIVSKIGITKKNKELSHKKIKIAKNSRKMNRSKSRHKKTNKEKKSTRK